MTEDVFKPWSEDSSVGELADAAKDRGLKIPDNATENDLKQVLHDFDYLPPAGDARDETLDKRKDALQQKAEELAEKQEVFALDPDALEVDREIRHILDMDGLEVSKADPNYVYSWTYFGGTGQDVWKKKRLGWEVVSGDMKEAQEHEAAVDGLRKIGDVLLMRLHRDRFAELEARDELIRQRQQFGVEAELRGLGDKYREHGFVVHTNLEKVNLRGKPILGTMEKAARREALKQTDRKLREGTVPGLRKPGSR